MFSAEKAWIADRVGDWHDPANWSPPGVPTPDDMVRIESGSVRLAQPVIIEGRLDWSGGRIHSGGMNIAPTGELNLLGGADKLFTAVTLNNGGLVRWQDTGRLIGSFTGFGQSVLITNLPGAEWSILNDTNLLFSSPGHGGEFFSIHNAGTIRKTASLGTTALEGPIQFRNAGLVAVDHGQLRFQQPIASEGQFTVAAGAAVELTTGRIDLLSGHAADGEGFFGLREGAVSLFGTVHGRFDWTGGRLAGSDFRIATDGRLLLDGAADKLLTACTVNNEGLFNWTGAGRLIGSFTGFGQSVLITNLPGGEWSIQTATNLLFSTPGVGGEFFHIQNDGLIQQTTPDGAVRFQGPIGLNNQGELRITVGQLILENGLTQDGILNVAESASLQVVGGQLELGADNVFAGGGLIEIPSGSVRLIGSINHTLRVTGGTVSGSSTVRGTLDWFGGRLAVGSMEIDQDGALNLLGDADKLLTHWTLNNAGSIRWQDAGRLVGSFTGFGQSVLITNLPGAEWSILNSTNILFSSPGVGGEFFFIHNAGTLRKSGSPGTTTLEGPIQFRNAGLVAVDQGQLRFQQPITSEGRFTVAAGAAVELTTGRIDLLPGHVAEGEGFFGLREGTLNLFGTVHGRFDWTGGQLVSSDFRIATDGRLLLDGAADKVLTASTLNNEGLFNWTGAGRLIGAFTGFGQSVLITNLPSGLFQVESDADLLLSSPGHGGELMRFSNAGDLVKLGGSATNSFLGVPTSNSGTITVLTGALDFPAGLANEGLITGGARIEFSSSTVFPPTEPLTLTLHGLSGLKYRVEASADLATWEEIALTNAPARTFQLLDPGAVGAPIRWYRAPVAPSN